MKKQVDFLKKTIRLQEKFEKLKKIIKFSVILNIINNQNMKNFTSLIILFTIINQSIYAQCWNQVSTGNNFTMAIKTDNTLWGWGSNSQGQLGDSTNTSKMIPHLVSPDSNWVSVSCGEFMTVAMKSDGSIWSWGSNNHSALGIGNPQNPNYPTQIGSDVDWVQIDAGSYHSVALKSDSSIWGWGQNAWDQLGNNNSVFNSDHPIQLSQNYNWTSIKGGYRGTMAINDNNQIWGSGSGNLVNISGTKTTFRLLHTDSNWINIFPSASFSHGINSSGELFSQGFNLFGQLGIDTLSNYETFSKVGSDTNWLSVHPGINHCLAIKKDHTLWAWGKNNVGELGDSTFTNSQIPIQIGFDTNWVSATARNQFSVALKSDGTLWSWGINNYGQLGLGNYQNYSYPQQITCAYQSTLNIPVENYENDIILFPNPTTKTINLVLPKQFELVRLKLFNSFGKQIINETYYNIKEINFDLLGEVGIYFLEVSEKEQILLHKKIIKQ